MAHRQSTKQHGFLRGGATVTAAALGLIGLAYITTPSTGGDNEPSIVPEAQASTLAVTDYGWRASSADDASEDGPVFEYH